FDSSSQGKIAQQDLEQSRPTATEGQAVARQQMQQQAQPIAQQAPPMAQQAPQQLGTRQPAIIARGLTVQQMCDLNVQLNQQARVNNYRRAGDNFSPTTLPAIATGMLASGAKVESSPWRDLSKEVAGAEAQRAFRE